MLPETRQQIRLFRFSGITVFLHWTWFLAAAYFLDRQASQYSSLLWNAAEYICLFGIVLMHEFGHALACRQVGGVARDIILWPLGGVAYVRPPNRPGAVLWSIAAGPLVNVALLGILALVGLASLFLGGILSPSAYNLLMQIWQINLGLLIFNLLPIYPLDGGQILRALLWFLMGRVRSLFVAVILGVVGAIGLVIFAAYQQSWWLGLLALFILNQCWIGYREAQGLAQLAKMPRHIGVACPSCGTRPLRAALWVCPACNQPFDLFASPSGCPNCGKHFSGTVCMECNQSHTLAEWSGLR